MNPNSSSFDRESSTNGNDGNAWHPADAERQNAHRVQGVDTDGSTGTLLRQLMHEVPGLIGEEIALARSEMRENLERSRRGIAAVSAGGVVLTGGYIVLLMAAVYAASEVMEPWLAALLVGGIAAVVGYAMLRSGMKRFSAEQLRPDHTLDSLRKDKNAIRGGQHGYH